MASSQGRSLSQASSVGMMLPPMPASGSFYGAFEECDRQARQRKYQIAELEDKIEHVKKTRKQNQETVKKLRADIANKEVEAKSAEIMYENKLKEKELMENKFRDLSKEMDEVTVRIGRKKSRVQEIKLFRQQKIDILIKTEENFMHQYRQYPKTARVIEAKEKTDEFEVVVRQKRQELERHWKKFQELKNKHAEAWEVFQKKCIKMAEFYVESQKKRKELQRLRGEYERTFRKVGGGMAARQSQKPLEAPRSVAGVSRSTFLKPMMPNRLEGIGSRLGVATFIPRRSSTFQQLDRMCQSNLVSDKPTDRRSFELGDRTKTYLSSGSSLQNASALALQIRSKLKDTVTVQPMPRNQESRNMNIDPATKVGFKALSKKPTVARAAAVCQPRQERDVQQPAVVDLCTPPPPPPRPKPNQVVCDSHQLEQMEVTEGVGKEQPQQEKIPDPISDPGAYQEMAEPVTAAEHSEIQPQSACNDGLLQMPTQPTGLFFSTGGETSNSPTKSPPDGSSFLSTNFFGGISSQEPSTSGGSGGFNLFGGDPFSSGSTPTTQNDNNFGFFF